jgi:hypothetical protein
MDTSAGLGATTPSSRLHRAIITASNPAPPPDNRVVRRGDSAECAACLLQRHGSAHGHTVIRLVIELKLPTTHLHSASARVFM